MFFPGEFYSDKNESEEKDKYLDPGAKFSEDLVDGNFVYLSERWLGTPSITEMIDIIDGGKKDDK